MIGDVVFNDHAVDSVEQERQRLERVDRVELILECLLEQIGEDLRREEAMTSELFGILDETIKYK